MKKITLLLMISIGLLISCKKEIKPKTETPMQATVSNSLVVDSVRIINSVSWEFGQQVFFSKNGNVTKLGCKMGSKGNFRVSFWDFTTENLIAATTISITDTTKFIYNSVTPISVTANTRYVISVNNTDNNIPKPYYIYYKKSNTTGVSIYPFTTGSVTYEAQAEVSSPNSKFPSTGFGQYFFSGLPDMQFEYTE